MKNDIFKITSNSKFYILAQNNNTSYTKEFNIFYKKYIHDLTSLDINKIINIYNETGIKINHYFYTKNEYKPILLKRRTYLCFSYNSLCYDKYSIYE